MRRWVCIVALLAGFAGQDYVWAARPRIPIPIERLLLRRDDTSVRSADWWLLP